MNKKLILASMLTASLLSGCAATDHSVKNNPVTVKIIWGDLNQFSDIDPGISSKSKFRKHLTRTFEKHINTLASQLPSGYKLYMVIDNIDLAGKVNDNYWEGREGLRVYDTFFNPEITFTYRLKNAQGEFVAAQDKFRLRNTHNGRYPASRFMGMPFAYEKYLLKDWFKYILLPHVEHVAKAG